MSVDSRLREARPDDDLAGEIDLHRAYERVRSGARRQRTRRTVIACGAVAAAVAVGGITYRSAGNGSTPSPAPAAPAPTATTTTSASPIDGEWTSPRLIRGDVARALEAAGVLSGTADDYVRGLPRGRFRIRMLIHQGLVQVSVGGDAHFIAVMSMDGGRLTLKPMSGPGTWVFRWQREQGRLSLDLVGVEVPDYDGFPPRVDALATFCSASFTQSS